MSRLAVGARWAALILLGAAYLVAAHVTAIAAVDAPWLGAALGVASLLLVALWLAWRTPWRVPALVVGALLGVALWHYWDALERNFVWFYFLQHAGTNIVLALVFAHSLTGAGDSLVTRLARLVHDTMPPELLVYTRRVTLAWALFFTTCAAISAGLFLFAPVDVWSVFANLLTLPLALAMFAAEYALRFRFLPRRYRASIPDTVRALRNFGKPAGPPAL